MFHLAFFAASFVVNLKEGSLTLDEIDLESAFVQLRWTHFTVMILGLLLKFADRIHWIGMKKGENISSNQAMKLWTRFFETLSLVIYLAAVING